MLLRYGRVIALDPGGLLGERAEAAKNRIPPGKGVRRTISADGREVECLPATQTPGLRRRRYSRGVIPIALRNWRLKLARFSKPLARAISRMLCSPKRWFVMCALRLTVRQVVLPASSALVWGRVTNGTLPLAWKKSLNSRTKSGDTLQRPSDRPTESPLPRISPKYQPSTTLPL